MSAKRWVRGFFVASIVALLILGGFVFIVDPYSVTGLNPLGIPYKLVKDDRAEKVAHLLHGPRYDNLLLGSSRVYLMNTRTVSRLLGGTTYNAGVGTARPEDILGFLLLLERVNRLPRRIVVGLDFYTFNAKQPSTSYFLRNRDLNFISYGKLSAHDLNKLFSYDALYAAWKVFHAYVHDDVRHPKFDEHGANWGSANVDSYVSARAQPRTRFPDPAIESQYEFVRGGGYRILSDKRFHYLDRVIELCRRHHIELTIFTTPVSAQLLDRIQADKELRTALSRFKTELARRTGFFDFLTRNAITENAAFFENPTHVKVATGNTILARVLGARDVDWPKGFGQYVAEQGGPVVAKSDP